MTTGAGAALRSELGTVPEPNFGELQPDLRQVRGLFTPLLTTTNGGGRGIKSYCSIWSVVCGPSCNDRATRLALCGAWLITRGLGKGRPLT
jgi:hypothetical protein